MNNTDYDYDAVIIGFGKGGKTLAAALAGAGRSVALIEKSKEMYGGTCINVGCIPTKSLVHSAKAAACGTRRKDPELYRQAMEQKEALVKGLRKKNYEKLNQNPNITIIDGTASFLSPHEVSVCRADKTFTVRAENFFINTGAVPFIPEIRGLRENPFVYTSETLLGLKELPDSLAIIGGGYIGVEFASIYADFGTKVTILQDGPVFLPREDADIAAAVKMNLKRRGVTVLTGVQITQLSHSGHQASLHYHSERGAEVLSADAVLTATGRRPDTRALNLAAAGVQTDSRGGILTDDSRTTSVSHIYAMGDVTGGLQFTYLSLDDYRIVRSKVLGDGSYTLKQRGAVPYSVFLNPPFSRVGMREQEAIDAGYPVQTYVLPVAAIPKAHVTQQTDGLLKAVVHAETGSILGAHLFCEESHELINIIKLAMDAGLHYSVLKDMIFTHPTFGEALNDLFASPK